VRNHRSELYTRGNEIRKETFQTLKVRNKKQFFTRTNYAIPSFILSSSLILLLYSDNANWNDYEWQDEKVP